MDQRITIALKVLLAFFLIGCLFDMPYFYFQFVRVVGLVSFSVLAVSDYQKDNKVWMIIWACSALIINPIIKIPLGRLYWNIIDIIWVIVIVVSLISTHKKNKENI
jgi:hypothetical protein